MESGTRNFKALPLFPRMRFVSRNCRIGTDFRESASVHRAIITSVVYGIYETHLLVVLQNLVCLALLGDIGALDLLHPLDVFWEVGAETRRNRRIVDGNQTRDPILIS